MTQTRRRLLLPLLALLVIGCAGTPAGAGSPAPTATPPAIASPSPSADAPSPSDPATLPPTGNVDERYPELAVSSGGPGHVVELTDPAARAWRITVSGASPADRMELLVEISDVATSVIVTTIVDGETVDVHDLTGIVTTPTSAAGGCHPVLLACYSSGGIDVDLEAGRVGFVVEQIEATGLTIVGATAGPTAEPFVLGPWRETAPFSSR